MGHFGTEKTIERILNYYWFPKMKKYVRLYTDSCVQCCYRKMRGGKPEGQLHYGDVEPVPFRLIHLDHLGPFVRSKRGNSYILAMSDAFSKFLIVKAVKNTKTAPVISALNEVTSYFGLPLKIVTDRGTAFTSNVFEDYCEHNNIQHVKTAVRTPRANGQVERANQTILSYIRTSTDTAKHWNLSLKNLQWTINSQKNSTSGFTPNELVFDFRLRDVVQNRILAAIHDDIQDETVPIAEKREQARQNIALER